MAFKSWVFKARTLLALQHEVGWLIAARLLMFLPLLVGVSLVVCGSQGNSCQPISIVAPALVVFGFSALSIAYLRRFSAHRLFIYSQIVFDLAAVTWLIYMSGGPSSPFLFLYIPVTMAAAIVRSRNTALISAAMGASLYSILATGMLYRRLAPFSEFQIIAAPAGGLLTQILGLISAMALTAVATSFLVRKVNIGHSLVQRSEQALSELSDRQKVLFDEIPEGVITTDLNQAITTINEAAQALFKLSENESIGKPLTQILQGIDKGIEKNGALFEGQREVTLGSEKSGTAHHVSYRGRPLIDKSGKQIGTVFVFQDVTRLRSMEEQIRMQERMSRLLAADSGEAEGSQFYTDLVGESQVMRQIQKLVERVARTDATVLIAGESGTGKELVARGIHAGSSRAHGPFIAVNCGAIPENLIESQLFGHKKGAFTSADSDHTGLFRQAESGTIFLDEIGELPLQLQTKLLRVIQEKVVRPVGGDRDIPINVRIVSATNRTLKDEVQSGKFREDLYYRLNVVSIKLPPLRQRRDDIPLLISVILKRLLRGGEEAVISPEAMQLLVAYDYPGNVRELENILERALVLGGSVILPEHLPDVMKEPKQVVSAPRKMTEIIVDESLQFPINLDELLATIERRYIEAALSQSGGAKKRAAGLLGMNFRSFRYRLQKFGMGEEV